MSHENEIMALEDRCRYLSRELAVAISRIELLEAQVQSLQMGAPRGIEIVSAPGDRCGGTRKLTGTAAGPCPGCRACS